MKKLQFVFSLGVLLFSVNSYAQKTSTPEKAIVTSYENFCLYNEKDFTQISRMAPIFKLKEWPNKFEMAMPAIFHKGGKVFSFKEDGFPLNVAYAINGGCSVFGKNLIPQKAISLLKEHYDIKLIQPMNEGFQEHDIYIFTNKSEWENGLLVFSYDKGEYDKPSYCSISFVPSKLVEKSKEFKEVISDPNREAIQELKNICLDNADDYQRIDQIALDKRMRLVSQNISREDPSIAYNGGKLYIDTSNVYPMIVGYAHNSGCSVIGKQLTPQKLASILRYKFNIQHYKTVTRASDNVKLDIYIFGQDSKWAEGLIVISSKFDKRHQNLITTVLFTPAKVVKEHNLLKLFDHFATS